MIKDYVSATERLTLPLFPIAVYKWMYIAAWIAVITTIIAELYHV